MNLLSGSRITFWKSPKKGSWFSGLFTKFTAYKFRYCFQIIALGEIIWCARNGGKMCLKKFHSKWTVHSFEVCHPRCVSNKSNYKVCAYIVKHNYILGGTIYYMQSATTIYKWVGCDCEYLQTLSDLWVRFATFVWVTENRVSYLK
jgi:hypothetical protein